MTVKAMELMADYLKRLLYSLLEKEKSLTIAHCTLTGIAFICLVCSVDFTHDDESHAREVCPDDQSTPLGLFPNKP